MSERDSAGRPSRSRGHAEDESTLRRLQARGGRLLHWIPEMGKWVPEVGRRLLNEGEPGIDTVLEQLQSLREQMGRRAQATGRDLEARAERVLGDLEKEALRRLKPLLARANVASRPETQALETRIAHLERRLGSLLDDRAALGSRIVALEHALEEARTDASERLREIAVGLSASEDVRRELAATREHLDTLSKEQVTRSLDLGRLHDRIVRLEMRFGDFLKEHGAFVVDQEEMRKRIAALARELELSSQATREVDSTQLDVLVRNVVERTLRQVELRLGDIMERQSAVREEQASLAARVSQLELAAARPATGAVVTGRAEGH